MIWLIWSYVSFVLGDSTIRYIYDTHNFNIICIISHSDIFPFLSSLSLQHICYYLISLHRTTGPSRCLLFVICNTFLIRKTGKTATIHNCCLIISHTPPTIQANVASSWSTYTKVSALHWYSYYCGLVYRIGIIFRTIQGECFL